MKGSKVCKLVLNDHGSYLGMEKGCLVVKNKDETIERFPLFENEIGEVVLKSGNSVSTGALASLGFWDVDVLIMTQRGRPVAMLKGLDDDSHVETRIAQYEAIKSEKGIHIAKQPVLYVNGSMVKIIQYLVEIVDLLCPKCIITSGLILKKNRCPSCNAKSKKK